MITILADTEMTYMDRISQMFDWEMDGPLYSSLIVMLIVLIFAIIIGIRARIGLKRKEYLDRPHGILMVGEWYADFCQNFATKNMGASFADMGGYFMTLFAYLFIAFNWGLTGMPSIIDWLAAPLSLALIMFVLIQFNGLRFQHWHYFHRYVEPIAIFLPINLVTMWTPIISTTMRLLGNCLSGTIIIGLVQWALGAASDALFGSLSTLAYSNYIPFWDVSQSYAWTSIWLAPAVMGVLNIYFSLFSAFVQTTVFSTLTALWIAQEKPAEEQPSLTSDAPRLQGQE